MKKTIMKEVTLCDACGAEGYVTTCDNCGVEHCYECRKTLGTKYVHSLYASGSGDGYFCRTCDFRNDIGPRTKKLLSAYRKIQQLRIVQEGFYKETKVRAEAAESEIKELRINLGLR